MTADIPVFVNGTRVDVATGATALDAIRQWDAAAASAVEAGTRRITDSRGLVLASDAPTCAGAIFRLVPAREADAAHPDDSED